MDRGLGERVSQGMAIDTLDTKPLDAPVPTGTAPVAVRPGAIVLVRHGEPALSRKCKLTSDGYRDWWGRYEEGGLLEGQTPPAHLKKLAAGAGAVFCSTRQRAIETARAAAGARNVTPDVMFIEAPLPPPHFPAWIRLSPRMWGFYARIWWWLFDHNEGQETFAEAKVRAEAAAQRLMALAAEGQDVLVLAHGFFNSMIGMALQRHGWKLTLNEGYRYWSQRRFEKR